MNRRVVVIANREPFRHERAEDGRVVVTRSASGLVTALEPIVEARHGVWVAHGAGSADRDVVDARDAIAVPPSRPAYRLRRVWLDADEQRGYYDGFANEGLWPLCHRTGVAPVFRAADFAAYARVNDKFAAASCQEAAGDAPVFLVQDYHFALVPAAVRRRRPRSTIVTFWHIPWPAARRFAVCRWSRDLLRGLLGSSTIGFHTPDDAERFLDTVVQLLHADVDWTRRIVRCAGRETLVGDYPISIPWPNAYARAAAPVPDCRTQVRRALGLAPDTAIVLGVDRLDYTKGLREKMRAFERLLDRHPEYRGRVAFVQIAEPSRQTLPAYRDLRDAVHAEAHRINARFASAGGAGPIVLREQHHDPPEVYTHFRAADVCFVGSLHDGMNLVAKEFVAARDDERGALVLSVGAGASRQLAAALPIDPTAIEETADVLACALRMPAGEQAVRMRALRTVVAAYNSEWWIGRLLRDACRPPAARPASSGEAA